MSCTKSVFVLQGGLIRRYTVNNSLGYTTQTNNKTVRGERKSSGFWLQRRVRDMKLRKHPNIHRLSGMSKLSKYQDGNMVVY